MSSRFTFPPSDHSNNDHLPWLYTWTRGNITAPMVVIPDRPDVPIRLAARFIWQTGYGMQGIDAEVVA